MPCLELGLSLTYLCDPFFIFIFTFMMINRTISRIQTYLLFCLLFVCLLRIIFKCQKFILRVLVSACLIFCHFQPTLLTKVLLVTKKICNTCFSIFFDGHSQCRDAFILQREQSPVLGKNRFIGKITCNYISYAFLKMHLQLVLCFNF